jgi:TolB protein
MRLAAGVRGRRAIAAVATVAAAAAAVGLAVPAMAAPAAPAARVLSGGQVASRSAVPWRKVGPGWALAEYSASQGGEGVTPKAGPSTLYLVSPQGGRYKLITWPARSPRANWSLIGWSGDVSRALFGTSPNYAVGPGREHVYQLQLRTGHVTGFTLPAKVTAVDYTRPDGLNILAEKSATATGTGSITVQRYSLTGKLQKNLVTFRDRFGFRSLAYNSKGTELAAGIANGLELIGNASGVVRKLSVSNEFCTAVRWWSSTTVLASCMVTSNPVPRMWLVPASGARPTALTPQRTSGPDIGDFNAWKLSSGLYVDGYAGCGADLIGRQPAHGKEQIINIPGADSPVIVNATKSTLMIERHNACSPGTSLVWFNPATRKMTVAIGVSHHEFGVTAVVPYFIAGKF